MKKKRGISLVEILVVLGILALFLAVGVPRLSFIQKYKEEKKMEELVINTMKARRLALDSYQLVGVTFDSQKYWVEREEEPIYESTYGGQLYLKGKACKVYFTRNGRPDYQSAQSLYFQGKYHNYKLIIAPVTGQVRWEAEDEKRGI